MKKIIIITTIITIAIEVILIIVIMIMMMMMMMIIIKIMINIALGKAKVIRKPWPLKIEGFNSLPRKKTPKAKGREERIIISNMIIIKIISVMPCDSKFRIVRGEL